MSNVSPSSTDLIVARRSRPSNKRSGSVSERTTKTPAGGKTNNKRRYSESESIDREVNKRLKMNVQEQKIADSVKEGMKEMMTTVIRKEFTEILDKRLEKMETDVRTLGERMDKIEEQQTEENMVQLAEQIEDNVCKKLNSRIDASMNASAGLYLKQLIAESEKNLIIIGWKGTAGMTPQQHIVELAKKIDLQEDQLKNMHINKAYRLGKVNEKLPEDGRPIFASFSSINSRNLFFENARNLPRSCRVEIDVPTPYRQIHQSLKEEAKKQRDFMDLKTKISFNGNALTLFIRKSKEEAWGIWKEVTPTAETLQKLTNKNTTTAETLGKKAHRPSAEETEKANKMIRIFNMPEESVGEVHEMMRSVLTSPQSRKLKNVTYKKGAIFVLCDDKKSAREICKKCNDNKVTFKGRQLEFKTL